MMVQRQGALHGGKHGGGAGFVEHEARGRALIQVFRGSVRHCVRQAAHVMHQGWGAVTQAVHLVQATGLEARGHEEDIRTCFDAVGQFLGVTQGEKQALGIEGCQFPQGVLEMRLAGAEDDEAGVVIVQDVGNHLQDEIHALLFHKAADEAQQGRFQVFSLHRHAQLLQQFLLVGALAGQVAVFH